MHPGGCRRAPLDAVGAGGWAPGVTPVQPGHCFVHTDTPFVPMCPRADVLDSEETGRGRRKAKEMPWATLRGHLAVRMAASGQRAGGSYCPYGLVDLTMVLLYVKVSWNRKILKHTALK